MAIKVLELYYDKKTVFIHISLIIIKISDFFQFAL